MRISIATIVAIALASPAFATVIDFGLPTWGAVNAIPTQDLVIGDLVVSTPTPDRLTWTTGDGLGVTGPTETDFASAVVGLSYEWDEVEGPQSLLLTWDAPVYVDSLKVANFFSGETRQTANGNAPQHVPAEFMVGLIDTGDPQHVPSQFMVGGYDEMMTLWLDGAPTVVTAQWADGFQEFNGLGWVTTLGLTAPGYDGHRDDDFTLQYVQYHGQPERPTEEIPEPALTLMLGVGLLVGQLVLRRRMRG